MLFTRQARRVRLRCLTATLSVEKGDCLADEIVVALPSETVPVPVRASWDPVFNDLFEAVAFGIVVDDWHGVRLRSIDSGVEFLLDSDQGPVVGFTVQPLTEFAPDDDDEDVWEGPRFDVPTLGLTGATVGEIMLAARARWGDEPSNDVIAFQSAIAAKEEDLESARPWWREVIEFGDLKGVFGLGYTLYDLHRYRDAYPHLRRYTEIAPGNSWAWCWYGMVCEQLGENEEAITAYERAVAAEESGSYETDAPEYLARLRDEDDTL